jgi:hypothetical protein
MPLSWHRVVERLMRAYIAAAIHAKSDKQRASFIKVGKSRRRRRA